MGALRGTRACETGAVISGISVKIFQDVEGIAWGEEWGTKIKASEDAAVY
jgi:hypothetical protein